jgi:integrase/recombinase XerD
MSISITIRAAKFGRSRLVPLHPSTRTVLVDYLQRRKQFVDQRRSVYVFVSNRGTRLDVARVHRAFSSLSRQTGLRAPGARNGPRLHDFRHSSGTRIIPATGGQRAYFQGHHVIANALMTE